MKTAIIGAGAWGLALANIVKGTGVEPLLWARNPSKNKDYKITGNLNEVVGAENILLAVPSQTVRENVENLKKSGITKKSTIIICAKGIEQGSLKLMSEIVSEILPENNLAILSGPNFAHEISASLPSGATIACIDKKIGTEIVNNLGSAFFRPYYSEDVIGAQIGGAVKNVIAIACGIAIGKGLGENARATIVTRGLAEIVRLTVAKGGNAETLLGLSGIGDIMLTCGSLKSRNSAFGYQIGQGKAISDVLNNNGTIEGFVTANSVVKLAEKLGVDMPICKAVNYILHENGDIEKVIKNLLERPLTKE